MQTWILKTIDVSEFSQKLISTLLILSLCQSSKFEDYKKILLEDSEEVETLQRYGFFITKVRYFQYWRTLIYSLITLTAERLFINLYLLQHHEHRNNEVKAYICPTAGHRSLLYKRVKTSHTQVIFFLKM